MIANIIPSIPFIHLRYSESENDLFLLRLLLVFIDEFGIFFFIAVCPIQIFVGVCILFDDLSLLRVGFV